MSHVCPWWGGYVIDNRLRHWLHKPDRIVGPYLKPGMHALDFGCGMGFLSIAMARQIGQAGRVIAVDLQQRMLDVLQKRAAKAGVVERIRTHCCEADRLGLSETVHFAVAFYSAHEVPDVRRLHREIYDLLTPDGSFLLAEPIGHVTAAAFRDSITAAEEAGFHVHQRPRVRLSHAALFLKQAPEGRP
jgi:ubiquinone/menaquinone biosynthesis C-methylase UbiE